MQEHYLRSLFAPASIAMFGASDKPDSVGQVVFRNLLQGGFTGPIYPINTGHEQVQEKKAWPNLESLGKPVDLAIVATPAASLPAIVEDCGTHGVKAMIVLSAGFREVGPGGRRLEEKMLEIARAHGIRILGPNCLGLLRPTCGLNASYGNNNARQGNIALISQSGAICTAILDWAESNSIGFSAVVSTGISADLDFGHILDYLVEDPKTKSILLYIEGLHDSRRFMSALRRVSRVKPVIALKVGRHNEGAAASMSHTGALVGGDDAFSAALSRSGVVRVKTIGQMFAAAQTLSSRYQGCGNRIAIVTNGGGPGVMAADRAADLDLTLAQLSRETIAGLNEFLPKTWSRANPVDINGDASPDRYRGAVKRCLDDPNVDAVLVLLTPQAMTYPKEVAEAITEISMDHNKPILTAWLGGQQTAPASRIFAAAGLPHFKTPEAAVDAISFLYAYHSNQELLLETPSSNSARNFEVPDADGARMIIESALAEGRKVLSETESMALLGAFHIPCVRNGIARSANEALVLASSIGFPVAMKIHSPDISHKSDAGGVRLNITASQAVRSNYLELIEQVGRNRPEARIEGVTVEKMYRGHNGRELMIGITHDPVFGPMISFGAGGTMVEVMGDAAVSLPPLNARLADELINRTRAQKMLESFRHMPPANRDELIRVLQRVSSMACELPWIQEMDINPLMLDENGAIAVDARFRVSYPRPSTDRYAHMAIHPYPAHLVSRIQLPNGRDIEIRPIRPEDSEIEQEFIRGLSDEAKYFRFMRSLNELSPEMLIRFTQIDYDGEMALIAVTNELGKEVELGVARYVTNPDKRSCEFALVVSDRWQGQGIGHRLMYHLMEIARNRGLIIMEGEVLSNNTKMLNLMRGLDFHIEHTPEDPGLTQVWHRL
jgi:acetyltransferase